MSDVSETQEIKIEAEDLLMSDRLNQSVMNATSAILVRMDTWHIVYATPKASKLFGYMKGELEGKSLDVLIPHDKREVHRRHVNAFLSDPSGRPMGEAGMQLTGLNKKGNEIAVAISLEPEVIMGVPFVTAIILLTH